MPTATMTPTGQRISDVGLASYITYLGFRISRITNAERSGRREFVFSEQIPEDVISRYYSDRAEPISPRKLFSIERDLKGALLQRF